MKEHAQNLKESDMPRQSRLLIVDDKAMNREILSRRLTRRGMLTHEVSSGKEAIEAIENESWDLVLLDIMMPDIDGLDVLKTAREKYDETELPIMMVSAKGDSGKIQESMDLGANDYITKPIDFLVAFFRIKAQLRLKQAVARFKELSKRQFEDEAARVSAIFNHVEVAIFNIGFDGRILSANPGTSLVFQFEIDDILGQNIEQFIPNFLSDDSKATPLKSGNHAVKIAGLTSQKTKLWLDVSTSQLNLSKESTWVVIVKDMTQQVLANQKLIESEARLRLAMAGSSDGIWDWNLRKEIIDFSEPWVKMLGYTQEEWAGNYQNWSSFIHVADRSRVKNAVEDFIAQRAESFSLQYNMRHKNGCLVPVLSRGFLQKDERSGHPIRFIGTHVDLTAQKEMEDQLKRANSKLEKKVANRTLELRSALKQAEASNQSKSDFLSMMSHEIRTPLNAIIGMSQLALKSSLNERQNHYVTQSHQAALTLLDLLGDILDFSKIESDKLELEKTAFELETVFKRLSASTAYSAQAKGLEYLFDIDPKTMGLYNADPTRLGQVLINFVGNAIKFTEEGEVVVQTKLIEQTEHSHTIEIRVIDSGIGMTEEQQERLFIPFSQADMSITRLYGGTGLGLAISRQLIELMGGTVSVESRKGIGTTFAFRVPLPLARSVKKKNALMDSVERENLRVLIVESNASSRNILINAVKHFGFSPQFCSSGLDAIEEYRRADAKNEPYDLLIMAWKLLGLDGLETTAVLERQNSPSPAKICMLVPTNVLEEFQLQRQSLKIASVVTKPYDLSGLWAGIAKALSQTQVVALEPETKYLKRFHAISGSRILLVEDHEVNQELAIEFLKLVEAEFEIANNGQEAIDILRASPFDLVLMDLHMPIMDGFTATKQIRRELKLTELPIIAMTAAVESANREEGKEVGIDDFIAKPFVSENLFGTIQTWLQSAQRKKNKKQLSSLFPQLNWRDALHHFDERPEDYLDFIKKFTQSYQNFEREFVTNIELGNTDVAQRRIHSLIELASTIGADELATTAGKLNSALLNREPRNIWKQLFLTILSEIKSLEESIGRLKQAGAKNS